VTWFIRLGWAVLALATLAIAAGIYLVELPEPADAIVLDRVTYVSGTGQSRPLALPHTDSRRTGEQTGGVRYLAGFDLTAIPGEPLFLYIPAVNRQLSLTFNGQPLYFSDTPSLWSGPMVRRSGLVQLPHSELKLGRNDVTVVLAVSQIEVPSYLSKIFVGSESVLTPNYNLRVFLEDRLKTMALAAQVLLGLGIFFAYFYRPNDPLFAWLAATVAVSLVLSLGFFSDIEIGLVDPRAIVIAISPAAGFLFTGIGFALVRVPVPRVLRIAAWLVPGISALTVVTGVVQSRLMVVAINLPILLAGLITATAVVAWGAFRRDGTEARLMLAPLFLFAWFTMRDSAVATGFIDGSLLVAPYARPIFLAAITAVLMRRLAMSLDDVDRANETLNRRLAEQEAELASLHRAEGIEAARLVREQERQRLTRDLHDGISGHLVSIIAMTERAGGDVEPIEQAARRALEDLRLVIYSLDLGDRELPLALANFRERLIPQLQRIGVELDWSTAELPEVSGVTPGNALNILRILQEAITNALKHGPARKIAIRGSAAGDRVAITVDNDGRPFAAAKSGFGLDNIRRRAHQLNGEVRIIALENGVRLTLLLPSCLPDVLDSNAGDIHTSPV
jgi:signal transduction histidine kinase